VGVKAVPKVEKYDLGRSNSTKEINRLEAHAESLSALPGGSAFI